MEKEEEEEGKVEEKEEEGNKEVLLEDLLAERFINECCFSFWLKLGCILVCEVNKTNKSFQTNKQLRCIMTGS
ncbi:MAG: hypothetical protein GY714_18425, partial [Desulfobacterales bacterium]|nr:hypothetical protein [Desulfobacterales bacterium]